MSQGIVCSGCKLTMNPLILRLDYRCTEFLLLITWTDDFPYFGTSKMVEWFEENVVVASPPPVVPVFAIWTRINQKVRIWVKSTYGPINPPQITIYAGPNVAFRCT